MEDYTAKKKKLKGQKQKNITKPTKTKYKKDRKSIIEIFHKNKKLKKEIMLTLKIKECQTKMDNKEKNT